MIVVNNLEFSYDSSKQLLNDVNIKIKKGKITTILGPNGSGKSTLLSLLSAFNKPKKGNILIDNQAIQEMKHKALAKKIATVHQQNEVPSDLTVEELVQFGRVPHQNYFQRSDSEDCEIVEWAMEKTKVKHLQSKAVMSLSGGERQRVFIAMALAQKTPILFLDEPTTYLDIYHQLEVLELVKQLNRDEGLTVVMVLHDINQALKYSDEVIVMKQGKVIKSGLTNEVLTIDLLKEVYQITGFIETLHDETFFIPLKYETNELKS